MTDEPRPDATGTNPAKLDGQPLNPAGQAPTGDRHRPAPAGKSPTDDRRDLPDEGPTDSDQRDLPGVDRRLNPAGEHLASNGSAGQAPAGDGHRRDLPGEDPASRPVPTLTEDESWRGVAAEDAEDLAADVSVKLQVRSRRLLGSLARPHLWSCVLALVIVIAQNAASMAGPLLIAIAIDDGIPNALNGNTSTLAWCVGAYFVSACANSFLLASFQRLSTRIGQDILLDLRQRIFRHVQRLSLSFHESYTSGKIISRLTADLDTINELLDDGLNKLLNAVLSSPASAPSCWCSTCRWGCWCSPGSCRWC
ncbi:hypothetical protein GCM10029964_003910 [Kibdelosporangium lantanae]